MKILRQLLLLITVLPFFSFAFGQSADDKQSPYVFEEFMPAIIHYENGEKEEERLNYNGITEEMIYQTAGRWFALDDLNEIEKIVFDSYVFIPYGDKFYEKIGDTNYGPFLRYKFQLIEPGNPSAYGGSGQTTATTNYSSLSDEKMLYNLKLPQDYNIVRNQEFYFMVDKKLEKVSNRRHARRIISDKRKRINEFVKDHDIDFSTREDMKKLGAFYDSID